MGMGMLYSMKICMIVTLVISVLCCQVPHSDYTCHLMVNIVVNKYMIAACVMQCGSYIAI